MIKGIDVGNGYTKVDGKRFASKFEVSDKVTFGSQEKEVHTVEYNGTTYTLGKGSQFLGDNRYFDIGYKLALLTGLAITSGRKRIINAKICVGLPILSMKRLSKKVADEILSWGLTEVIVDGVKYSINIQDVTVFVEGAIAIYNKNEQKLLSIDVGAGTVNVIEWNGQAVVKSKTLNKSLNKLHSDVERYLQEEFGITDNVQDYFGKEVAIVNQEATDISGHLAIIDEGIKAIKSEIIKSGFNLSLVEKITLLGGGVLACSDLWKKHFKTADVEEDSQFVNSKVYKAVALGTYKND